MFSPDSKFMQVISRIVDLILLNIVYLLTCLPVFTIGAATTALYTMAFRLMREEYRGVILPYFQAFRANFKQSTLAWGILLLVILPALYYFDWAFHLTGIVRVLCLFFFLILFLGMTVVSYVFPWLSQFENSALQSLKNALLLGISNLPKTLAILVINLLPVILWLVQFELFLQISYLWVVLYFAAAAYMNTGLLWHVFKPYRSE